MNIDRMQLIAEAVQRIQGDDLDKVGNQVIRDEYALTDQESSDPCELEFN